MQVCAAAAGWDYVCCRAGGVLQQLGGVMFAVGLVVCAAACGWGYACCRAGGHLSTGVSVLQGPG